MLLIVPGYRGAALAAGVLALVGISLGVRPTSVSPRARHSFSYELNALAKKVPRMLSNRSQVLASASSFPFTALWWVGGTSFTVLYVVEQGLPTALAAVMVVVRTTVATVLRLSFAPLKRRWGLLGTHLSGSLLAAAGLAACGMGTGTEWLIGCAAVQGAGLSIVLPASNTMVTEQTSQDDQILGFALPFAVSQTAMLILPLILGAA